MKKTFFIVVFAILSTAIYGQESQIFPTSDGFWSCQIEHIGRNKGQENANLFGVNLIRLERLSNNQQDIVRRMLNKYQHSRGDTFYLTLSYWPRYWSNSFPKTGIIILVEYKTNTEWVYWAFNALSER